MTLTELGIGKQGKLLTLNKPGQRIGLFKRWERKSEVSPGASLRGRQNIRTIFEEDTGIPIYEIPVEQRVRET